MRGAPTSSSPAVQVSDDGLTHEPIYQLGPNRFSPADVATPAANAPAVVSYGGQALTRHEIAGVAWSYSAGPTNGNLQILDDAGGLVLSLDITAAGPSSILFDPPLTGSPGKRMIITLAAGGGTTLGKLSVIGHRIVSLIAAPSPLSLNFSQAVNSGFVPALVSL
jgi:hypothetical protein